MDDVNSIIQAHAVDVDEIKRLYGKTIAAEDISAFTLDSNIGNLGGLGYNAHINKVSNIKLDHHCVVLERYNRPTKEHPNGQLTIVAGDKLLFDGELPYLNGDQVRTFPFAKQISNYMPGSFFGVSVVDRLIPIQRAYNAVRNRKHEYFNRAVMNVLAVEDGSVDTDSLEIEGLSPGKVLVYRQGSHIPEVVQNPSININFDSEEERLLGEFKTVSGVSDMMTDSYSQYTSMSGVALQLLAEQDLTRLATAIDSTKQAIISVGKQILRLYKQFAVLPRMLKLSGDNGSVKMYYWDQNEITSDDVVFDASTDGGESLGQRRSMLMDLLNKGLLYDKNGEFSQSMRKRCLDLLGFGMWEDGVDLNSLHINHAKEENLSVCKNKQISVMPIDQHQIHIDEHTAFVLSEMDKRLNQQQLNLLLSHIEQHKKLLAEQNKAEETNNL